MSHLTERRELQDQRVFRVVIADLAILKMNDERPIGSGRITFGNNI